MSLLVNLTFLKKVQSFKKIPDTNPEINGYIIFGQNWAKQSICLRCFSDFVYIIFFSAHGTPVRSKVSKKSLEQTLNMNLFNFWPTHVDAQLPQKVIKVPWFLLYNIQTPQSKNLIYVTPDYYGVLSCFKVLTKSSGQILKYKFQNMVKLSICLKKLIFGENLMYYNFV